MTNVYIQTHGCSLNASDSEKIAGVLEKNGFKIVCKVDDSDVVIVNSCTVKSPTVNKIKRYIKECQGNGKKVVLAGCAGQADPEFMDDISMIGPSQIENIVQVVEETLNGNFVKLLVIEDDLKIKVPILRKNHIVEILPICQGCLGDPCTYCIVKSARGDLHSYNISDIVERVKRAVIRDRVREIWLTAQDTGCYGYDIKTNIVELLKEVLKIKGNFKVRLGMANPNHVLENLDELVEVFKDDKMFKFLHIPIQSGSNSVLEKMSRKYTVEEFKNIVEKFRVEMPLISISTDVICGFPEETDEQFKETVELIKWLKPDVLNLSKFWLRPGTKAEFMEQVPGEIIKERTRHLAEVFGWIKREINKKWVGKKCRVIVDEKGKSDTMVSRNEAYKPVILKDVEIGEILDVEIVDFKEHDLFGKIL